MTDSRILEDWLTFTFSNARKGQSSSYIKHNISSSTLTGWLPRMYCMNCGALWTMDIRSYSCDECGTGTKQMRMLVCRYRKLTKTISVKFQWWNPATWWFFDRVIDEGGVWEYRLKESEVTY